MKKLFQITASEKECAEPVLCIKTGERYFSFAVVDKAAYSLKSLFYYTFAGNSEFQPGELFAAHPELKQNYNKTIACFDYSRSVIIPTNELHPGIGKLALETAYGLDSSFTFVSEQLSDWQVRAVSYVPEAIQKWVTDNFKSVSAWNEETILLNSLSALETPDTIFVDFRHDLFSVQVISKGKLQISKTGSYNCPEDVLYQLLKICEQFSLQQEQIVLRISGLIDKHSALFRDLHQYFLNAELRNAPWRDDTNEYPAHFFTSLNDLYLCGS